MEIVYNEDFTWIKETVDHLIEGHWKGTIKLSFIEHSWEQIKIALTNVNILNSQKIVVLEDALFLMNKNARLHESFNLERFWKLISNLPLDVKLILIVPASTITHSWPKTINPQLHHCKEFQPQQLVNRLKAKLFMTLSDDALNYLMMNVQGWELREIDNEINKINHLFLGQKAINLDQLKTLIKVSPQLDIFKMGTSFLNEDLDQFLESWFYGFEYEVNGQQLIGLLTKQLSTLWWVQHYRALKLNNSEIAQKLGLNPYYLHHLTITNHQISTINDKIKSIYKLNKQVLLGKIDKKVIPEYLFLKMFPQSSERKENGTH